MAAASKLELVRVDEGVVGRQADDLRQTDRSFFRMARKG